MPSRAATPAIAALLAADLPHRVHKYRHDARSASFGAEAADHLSTSLGADPAQVFKTLVVATGGDGLAVVVLPVPARCSFKAAAAALGVSHAEMADPTRVQRVTGYVLGGVSPLGQKRALPTVVDESALAWSAIYCSAGRRGLEIELAPQDLISSTGATTAPVTAGSG